MIKAPVNKIIPFSSVDGPGNRTAVFTQGCGYNCEYCHNPETIHMCINCGGCVAECPVPALSMVDGKVEFDHVACCGCDTCISVCPHGASPRIRMMDAAEVMEEIGQVRPFIRGLTTSGGECTTHPEFLKELYTLAKEDGLHILIDSNGSYNFGDDPYSLLDVADGVMLDFKAFTPELHQKLIGAPVEPVKNAAKTLAERGKLYEIRTVVIPDVVDEEEVSQIADFMAPFLKEHPDIIYKLIKYRSLGVRDQYRTYTTPTNEKMNELSEIAKGKGFKNIVII